MKIAILYVCTGKYDVFWDEFYSSSEENFYPDVEKTYFIFTDCKRMLELKEKNVQAFCQARSGWPYDTLLRFNWFCTIQDKLEEYDACYFINANGKFLKKVTPELIPFPSDEEPMILSVHINNYEDTEGKKFAPERNPMSTAYIPEGAYCRAHSGGFFGGRTKEFLEMCRKLRDRIAKDLQNGIIAIWHDQSHLIKYATEIPHYNVEKGLVASEEYADLSKCLMIFRDKRNYGGNVNLRQLPFSERIKELPKKIYSRILKLAKKIGMDTIIRRLVKGRRTK